jgi:LEA14-like dessication related protein
MTRRGFLIASGLFCALAACSGLSGITQKPEISLAGIELVDFGLFEQRFKLGLRIQNPNDVALPIQGLSFDVELNGQHFAKGVSDQAVTVPRFGEAVLTVTATSNLGNVLRQLNELQKSGRQRADYRISGRLELAGVGNIPFERKGDVAMPVFDPPR